MPDIEIVKRDEGGVNARIVAKENKTDFRRIEAASLKMPSRFTSAEGKRAFVRLFNTLQLNTHFISVIARTRLEHAEVAQVEAALREQVDRVASQLNEAIDSAEAMFQAHGITEVATFDTVPLDMAVPVLSSLGRRYLEVIGKLDQLMPMLQTLEIHEVMTPQAVDERRALLKREVRNVANASRNLATGLRRRMNALGPRDTGEASPVGVELSVRGAVKDAAGPTGDADLDLDADPDSDPVRAGAALADGVAWIPSSDGGRTGALELG